MNKTYKAAVSENLSTSENYQIQTPSKRRLQRYGISQRQWCILKAKQHNKCAICREIFTTTPCVDHNHKTDEIRGLLCQKCNRILGQFRDNVTIFNNAIEYLKQKATMHKHVSNVKVQSKKRKVIENTHICVSCGRNIRPLLPKKIDVKFKCRLNLQIYTLTIETEQQFCTRCWPRILNQQVRTICQTFKQ
jgi:hypothetical protein